MKHEIRLMGHWTDGVAARCSCGADVGEDRGSVTLEEVRAWAEAHYVDTEDTHPHLSALVYGWGEDATPRLEVEMPRSRED